MSADVFDLRLNARALSALAVATLGNIMRGTGSDAARLGAAREVLDRAYGKCRAADEGADEPYTVVIRQFGDGADNEG
jgi:hypothetical protein